MAAVPVAVGPPAAPAPVFGLRPSDLVPADQFVDYGTTEGRKTYTYAIKPLEVKFDGDSQHFRLFINDVGDKGRTTGWTNSIKPASETFHVRWEN